ncbi:hypothetical protein ACQP1P_32285 [Dactylosporangium sp. CA-052675]|uniref:hypothetical protein n=1 Tax=Dactylosporangium sp. CA-052675 TaxID=3239927 RepID=UPI003D8C5EF7
MGARTLFSAAALAAAAAGYAETAVASRAFAACDVGANNVSLLLIAMPVLWVAQTTLVTGGALLLSRLSPSRALTTAATAALALALLALVPYGFFLWAGLPLTDAVSRPGGHEPARRPSWLPPAPHPDYR